MNFLFLHLVISEWYWSRLGKSIIVYSFICFVFILSRLGTKFKTPHFILLFVN
ncbi:hypothetical protein RchiOBHm_Chr3g0494241 [Rosa chinensis]|uniref:Uncharacterized protein n=1 Tax=Rosa chinensis TaxID=74649 RepID=A0A2P6RGX0_ROSCH|nr:hypothetical protein RchiOBHm_Chr3g0494241 [Rosa chinensis]